MADTIGPRRKEHVNDDILLETFLDPSYEDISSGTFDDDITWNPDEYLTDTFKMDNEANLTLADSTWNAINAWLFDILDSSPTDVKQEPVSPYNGSMSSFSSENEIDTGLLTIIPNTPLNPEKFLSQPVQPVFSKEEVPSTNTAGQNDSGIFQIVNDAFSPPNATLNETQLKVYQTFIPIKPKVESQDAPVTKCATANSSIAKELAVLDQKIQMQDCVENAECLQAKRKFKMENDTEQRFSRKQKRMARNRESALQSRQKKKELMQTLEVRLNALSNINSQLKNENDLLKDKIKQLENENLELKHKRPIDVPDLAKKTSCVLVLFVFLAINMKPLSNISSSMPDPAKLYKSPARHGRFLLEYDKKAATEEAPVYQNIVYNRDEARLLPSEALMDILDRKILRKIKRLYKLQGLVKRGQLQGTSSSMGKDKGNETNDDCSMSFNKTEVYRLNEALEKFVKLHKKKARKVKKNRDDKKPGSALKNLLSQPINCTSGRNNTSNCSRKVSPKMIASSKQKAPSESKRSNPVTKLNEVQTFQYDWSVFENFQKSINRQPDTFYFVSFRKDHILLPPLHHNETQRPRVSFILPSSNSSHPIWNSTGDKVSLMQIDCQVMDTKIFHILKSNIPRYKLPFSNFFLKQT